MDANNIIHDSCENVLDKMEDNFITTIITDPPYGLKFKGNKWDYSIPSIEAFQKMFRVLKPGGTMLCFGGSRTFHRLAVNIEEAGFHIMDTIMWLYGSGFPKSVDIAYVIDKNRNRLGDIQQELIVNKNPMGGKHNEQKVIKINKPNSNEAEEWNGWGTALKPSFEPILVCRKPIEGNYDDNALNWGVSGYWIDGARINTDGKHFGIKRTKEGRWPTNVIINEEVKDELENQKFGASNFFYCAKPTKEEKGLNNTHDTVKPLALIKYLCTLTKMPQGGIVLDPYAGSGTTGIACEEINRPYILIEKEKENIDIIHERISKYKTL